MLYGVKRSDEGSTSPVPVLSGQVDADPFMVVRFHYVSIVLVVNVMKSGG